MTETKAVASSTANLPTLNQINARLAYCGDDRRVTAIGPIVEHHTYLQGSIIYRVAIGLPKTGAAYNGFIDIDRVDHFTLFGPGNYELESPA